VKTIIKLLVVALIANAGFQAGRSYYGYYQFKHDVHMETLNRGREQSDEIQRHILEMAEARGYEMAADDVQVSLDPEYITIDMAWVDNIELVPRYYARDWPYEGRVQIPRVKPGKLIR
jgi:hypothetical protein